MVVSSHADLSYPSGEKEMPEPVKPREEAATPLVVVDSETGMQELVKDLKSQRSIAVDLEHHNYRSYQGFTCLIQVASWRRLHHRSPRARRTTWWTC